MAKPNVTFLWNNTANDGANTGNASGGVGGSSSNWVVMDLVNDKLCFFDSQMLDGAGNTTEKYPVIIPAAGSIEAPKTFINDSSAGVYDQVPLAGTTAGGQSGGDKRYVFCIYFDGATAGIPYLEAWDDNTHATIVSPFLGTGTPANSTLRAVTTTNAAPGSATWTGTPLAGTGSRIALDTTALLGAKGLYFQIKQNIASTMVPTSSTSVVLSLRYLYS
jgi:hypothetical protein